MSIDLHEATEALYDRTRADRPVRAVIRTVQPETETVKIENFGEPGVASVTLRHPFMSQNAWIRCMPEAGTPVVTQAVREPRQTEMWGYVTRRLGELLARARADDSAYVFRKLPPGEIEIMSSGRAYTHWSEEGNLSLYGGIVEQLLQQTELEIMSRAPTHKRHLDQEAPDTLAHEERFGLVKRKDQTRPFSRQSYVKDGSAYQYEYGRWLNQDDGKLLTSLQEGHIYDEDAKEIKNSLTGRRVRLRRIIRDRTQQSDLTFDVDEDLNLVVKNNSQSKTTDLNFGLQNVVKLTSKQFNLNVLATSNQRFTQSLSIFSPKVRIDGIDIGFGSSPSQPAVLGTALVSSTLSPMISMTASALTILSADTSLATATKQALKNMADSYSALSSSLALILSKQVKFTL
jgi:hypothetical protein